MTPDEKATVQSVSTRLEEVVGRIEDLAGRVDELEEDHADLKELPAHVSELKGMVTVLNTAVTTGFDGVRAPLRQAAESSSTKNAIQFAAIVLVPIILALIGAYVTLKAGGGK